MMGVPAANDADPSLLVAILAPLMFGYMFGDVGQGLVLVAVGLYLRRRWPLATLIVAGGAAALAGGEGVGVLLDGVGDGRDHPDGGDEDQDQVDDQRDGQALATESLPEGALRTGRPDLLGGSYFRSDARFFRLRWVRGWRHRLPWSLNEPFRTIKKASGWRRRF